MATAPRRPLTRTVDYPTTDGKPMAETETHRDDMMDLIQSLQDYFTLEPLVCVSGNMLMYYEEGNRRKHVSPDVFVVRGIEKKKRDNYLIWEDWTQVNNEAGSAAQEPYRPSSPSESQRLSSTHSPPHPQSVRSIER
jgi:hypothetical protein